LALYCKNCKKEVPDGSFCPSCGKILDSFVSYAETQRQVQTEIEDEENGKQLKLYFGRHKHFVDFYSKGKEILTNLNVYWYDNYNNYGQIIEDNELQYTWETIDLTKISG